MAAQCIIHVAVGVIYREGKILLAKRAEHQHQGGLWEFPGGKVETGEHVTSALKRELTEEVAIVAIEIQPLIQIRHDYGDKVVLLDVWTVTEFDGEPRGEEGQPLVWVEVDQLNHYNFPAANQAIVTAITLPSIIAVTPSQGSKHEMLSFCRRALALGAGGLQLRSTQLGAEDILWLYAQLSQSSNYPIWVNSVHVFNNSGEVNTAVYEQVQRVHIGSSHIAVSYKLGDGVRHSMASCHNQSEILSAQAVGVQAVYLSPVMETACHPSAAPLGWEAFSQLVAVAKVPVYALGGMKFDDVSLAKGCYAQGLAGISLFQL